jgi:hypothetical protein
MEVRTKLIEGVLMSILNTAIVFLEKTRKRTVKQVELLTFVSQKTKKSRESVRGTICKSVGGVYDPKILQRLGFKFERSPARLIKDKSPPKIYQSYHCPVKQSVRERIFANLKHGDSVATFGGHEGLCVKHLISLGLNLSITNIENNPDALTSYKMAGYRTNDFLGVFTSFFSGFSGQLDLLNYDSYGYMCRYMAEDFAEISRRGNVKRVAITILGIKRFRNHGPWVSKARAVYGHLEDPTLQCIKDLMPNYKCVDSFFYQKTNVKQARPMRVIVMELAK